MIWMMIHGCQLDSRRHHPMKRWAVRGFEDLRHRRLLDREERVCDAMSRRLRARGQQGFINC
ncbi:uncharacterized protein SEPMUDRAFT_65636 [Sphaerulina musiva SO2202]|uniref:Uncharacterized protein n=1 Tax=Sphaerulina musiva (strain SO2202) TaxID=692275 RepID=M3D2Q6_SPHMS|nr:uncharacterized protein SEPMUDRAFT_65636 [Sphaerulina musiva SO2202]EMF12500.1 hypothetical protein SEPMUDRAFT_65636 [Sphaerulina musiva SO2202]